MEAWFNSLSDKELSSWIRMMASPFGMFIATDQEIENIKLAKQILNNRRSNKKC